jgi:tetratricopeptide (TPR) repeat protein
MVLVSWTSKQSIDCFVQAEKYSRQDQYINQRIRALVGMIPTLILRGHRTEAKAYSQELASLAERTQDRTHLLFAHEINGQNFMYDGVFRKALLEFDRARSLYDDVLDGQLAFRYGHDPAMISLWWTAFMQWETGLFNQAFQSSDMAMEFGKRIGHAFSLALALCWRLDLAYHMWLPKRVLQHAQEGIDFAQRHGFAQLQAMCIFHHGWGLAQGGQYDGVIEQMSQALKQYVALGWGAIVAPRMTTQLASVYGQAGRAEEGFRILHSSPDRAPGHNRVRYPEISRIEGELHLLKPIPDLDLAEHSFKEAIEIAIEDENKAKQLRAATSLAKLWRDQGKIQEARALLEPVYASFTEGFDFPDMKNARALLDSLSSI